MPRNLPRLLIISLAALLLDACSMGQMVARSSLSIMDSSVVAMNRETDLELARAAIPADLKLVEGLVQQLPDNAELRVHAAMGFYGYAFAFVEDDDPARAAALYRRGMQHALSALQASGLKGDASQMQLEPLQQALARLDRSAVPALFWSASNWAKWIDLNRTEPARIAEIAKVAALMQRALELDENYYYGGAHVFFGVFYGARPPMLGGDFALAHSHFDKARRINQDKLLIVDVLDAQYLARQEDDRKTFHDKLTAVLAAPPDRFPEMAFANAVAQQKAKRLLAKEEEWF